jgi:hypothetical protein
MNGWAIGSVRNAAVTTKGMTGPYSSAQTFTTVFPVEIFGFEDP